MNTESLEKLLREKVATESPRPGFETRIQAMAREPRVMENHRSYRGLAGLGLSLAALALVISLPEQPKPSSPALVEIAPAPVETKIAIAETKVETPVQKEIEGMKSDARRAFDFLSGTVPSMIEK
ncbi:hypothetical protein V2O64_21100 [Verrucomicrobiaceae bacterium 227]